MKKYKRYTKHLMKLSFLTAKWFVIELSIFPKRFYKYTRRFKVGLRPQAKMLVKNPRHLVNSAKFKSNVKKTIPYAKLFSFRLLLPVALAAFGFVLARPSFAQLSERDIRLIAHLAFNDVEVGTELSDTGIDQIYYEFDGEKKLITKTNTVNADPVTEGDWVAWMSQIAGSWQIFLYHIPTDVTTQLTYTGNNVNPKLSAGKVVWEGNRGANWQVFLYDGTHVGPITYGDKSVRPSIFENYIVYARQNDLGDWRTEGYWITTRDSVLIAEGEDAEFAELKGLEVFIGLAGASQSRWGERIDDIFYNKLTPFPEISIKNLSNKDIVKEIESLISQNDDVVAVRGTSTGSGELAVEEVLPLEEIQTATTSGEIVSP